MRGNVNFTDQRRGTVEAYSPMIPDSNLLKAAVSKNTEKMVTVKAARSGSSKFHSQSTFKTRKSEKSSQPRIKLHQPLPLVAACNALLEPKATLPPRKLDDRIWKAIERDQTIVGDIDEIDDVIRKHRTIADENEAELFQEMRLRRYCEYLTLCDVRQQRELFYDQEQQNEYTSIKNVLQSRFQFDKSQNLFHQGLISRFGADLTL